MSETVFSLPDLGEGLEDAEIVEWKVGPGDEVGLNQPLVEVSTAKTELEIPSPLAGRVRTLHAGVGDTVAVGAPLVTFTEPVHAAPEPPAEPVDPAPERPLVGYGLDTRPAAAPQTRLRPPEERLATPPVARLAEELRVDLASVQGSGPGGRITRADVRRAADAGSGDEPSATGSADGQPVQDERIPLRGVRRTIFQRLTRSWTEIPHVTTWLDADATVLEGVRRDASTGTGIRLSPLPFVVAAMTSVLKRHPVLNAVYDAEHGEIVLKRHYAIGLAVDGPEGLAVPVIRDADRRSVPDLAGEIRRLADAARSGRAALEDLVGSTFTISNAGSYGSSAGTPIINYPETAILGVGVIEPRALVINGNVEARPAWTFSLSFDHRLIDGAEATRALHDLRDLLADRGQLERMVGTG